MSSKLKNFSLITFTFILIILFTPFFGNLYELYFGPVSSGFFWGPPHPEYIDGFLISYIFFITLLLVIFLNPRNYLWMLIAIWPIVISLMSSDGLAFMVDLTVFIIAFILAQIILFIYKKFKK